MQSIKSLSALTHIASCRAAHTRVRSAEENKHGERVREIDTTSSSDLPQPDTETRLPLVLLSIFPGSYLLDTAGDTLDSDPKYRVHLIIPPPAFPYAAVVNPKCASGSAGVPARSFELEAKAGRTPALRELTIFCDCRRYFISTSSEFCAGSNTHRRPVVYPHKRLKVGEA